SRRSSSRASEAAGATAAAAPDGAVVPNFDPANWMSQLPPAVAAMPLCQLALPGSHDSFASSFDLNRSLGPDSPELLLALLNNRLGRRLVLRWSKTQSLSLLRQLESGIRYLDLRVALIKGQFYLLHSLVAISVPDALDEVATFVAAHPAEAVLLDFNHFYSMDSLSDMRAFQQLLISKLGRRLSPPASEVPSLAQLRSQNQSVLAFQASQFDRSELPALWESGTWMPSPWPNTTDIGEMVAALDRTYSMPHGNHFLVLQAVLTPDAGFILRHPLSSLRNSLSLPGNRAFVSWLRQGKKALGCQGVNVAITDFVEDSDFVQAVAGLNFHGCSAKSFNGTDWMSQLPESAAQLPLCQLALPGSHDSCTEFLDLHRCIGPDSPEAPRRYFNNTAGRLYLRRWWRTQSLTIRQQLDLGIRYLDLRVAKFDDGFRLLHSLISISLEEVLDQIADFVAAHPAEAVLLDFNHFYSMDSLSDMRAFQQLLISKLGRRLSPPASEVPSLAQLRSQNQSVLAFQASQFDRSELPALWESGTWMPSPWPNTTDIGEMVAALDRTYSMPHGNHFLVLQAVLTPDAGFILRHPLSSLRNSLSLPGNRAFVSWLRQGKKALGCQGVNVAITDFVEDSDFVQAVAGLNFQ
uniref:PLCXc domain-containing protein n=1 Tax=Macrostomum lignano TaxID=282301 RepID=A0A1I8FXJ0_9PLAT